MTCIASYSSFRASDEDYELIQRKGSVLYRKLFCILYNTLTRLHVHVLQFHAESQIRAAVAPIPQSLRIPRSHLKMSTTAIGQGGQVFHVVVPLILTDMHNDMYAYCNCTMPWHIHKNVYTYMHATILIIKLFNFNSAMS